MNTDIAAQHAIDRLDKAGAEALSDVEKVLVTAWLFEAGVSNSGFLGYFAGVRGDLAYAAPDALRVIGAAKMADLATAANAVFGAGGPPRNREMRRKAARELAESARSRLGELDRQYFECAEDIDELLEQYLERSTVAH